MESRTKESIIKSFKSLYNYLTQLNFKPKLNFIDNACSEALQDYIKSENRKIQFVEAGQHLVKSAKSAIQTFKNHFISAIFKVHRDFLMEIWCQLLSKVN